MGSLSAEQNQEQMELLQRGDEILTLWHCIKPLNII